MLMEWSLSGLACSPAKRRGYGWQQRSGGPASVSVMKFAALSLAAVTLTLALPFVTAAQDMPMPNKESHGVNVVLPAPLPATDANIAKLKVPAGFRIAKFAEGLEKPRVIVASPAGNLYVSSRDAGTITMIAPDGKQTKVLELQDVHGMVIHEGTLYYVTIKEVYSAPINRTARWAPPR